MINSYVILENIFDAVNGILSYFLFLPSMESLKWNICSFSVSWCWVINRERINFLILSRTAAPVALKITQSPSGRHAWDSTANSNWATLLNQFLHVKLAAQHELREYVIWWCSVMSQSHRIKGWTTDEAFEEQCFLWERGASVGADFYFFNSFTCRGANVTHRSKQVSFN